MKSRLSRLVPAALVAVLLVGLAACSSSGSGWTGLSGRVDVVAAENFWGNIAQQIGGSHVQVTSIISDPNTDPHVYQSDPRDAAEISNAQLVIENGLGYDDFIDKILATGGRSGRRVLSVQKVLDVTGSDPNPHVWYWTARLPQVAGAIAAQLSALDPKDAADFSAGAKRFDASLKPLLATIAAIKKKYAGTKISYTERVPGYLVDAAGLVLGTPASFSLAIEDGNDPSPQDTETFDADITGHKVSVLLYNSQVVDAQTTKIKQLATSAGIPIVGVSETLPPSYSDFQAWQLAQDRDLLQALGG
ncbi:MAG TPA: zinc ABC transporter substrate-binding protein [Mycobacteriales bacterium]|nr:zinc ABC transporter substrate-binding protein [Mycobacteriales bacterium]